jgi:late competence protein required for DNA uptake (superfamily II DNA/RNA helicase)
VVVPSSFSKAAMRRRSFHAGKIQQLCSFFEHQKKASRFVLFFIQKIKEKNTIFL